MQNYTLQFIKQFLINSQWNSSNIDIFIGKIRNHDFSQNTIFGLTKEIRKEMMGKKLSIHFMGRLFENILQEFPDVSYGIIQYHQQYLVSRYRARFVMKQLVALGISIDIIHQQFQEDEFLQKNISILK